MSSACFLTSGLTTVKHKLLKPILISIMTRNNEAEPNL